MNNIRQAVPADASRIAEIIIANYRVNFYPFFRDDEYYFKELNVADMASEYSANPEALNNTYVFDDGVIKGIIRLRGTEIEKLFVEPQFQSQGIGAGLLRFAAEEKGSRYLWALEYNKRAIAFYERNGFALTGERIIEDDVVPLLKMSKISGNTAADEDNAAEVFAELGERHLPQMTELYRSAFSGEPWYDDWNDERQLIEYVREISSSYNSLNFGLFIDGRLAPLSIGIIRHWWEGTNYNIEEFCVCPGMQGKNTGTRFMGMIEAEIKKRGLSGIFLQTDSDKPAYGFYLKNGFRELDSHISLYKRLL